MFRHNYFQKLINDISLFCRCINYNRPTFHVFSAPTGAMWVPRNRYAHALATAPLVVVLQTTRYWSDTQWRKKRGNVINGTAYHQRPDFLLNRLSRHRSMKMSTLRVTGLYEGNPSVSGEFPSQRPVMQKRFPLDDVTWIQTDVLPQDLVKHRSRKIRSELW